MDQRIVDLFVVWILWLIIVITSGLFSSFADGVKSGDRATGCLAILIVTPFASILSITLSGTVIYMLWGIVAPTFGWPRIDLITAVAISWLSAALTRGFTAQRVKVEE